jgi:hypothetical protein
MKINIADYLPISSSEPDEFEELLERNVIDFTIFKNKKKDEDYYRKVEDNVKQLKKRYNDEHSGR